MQLLRVTCVFLKDPFISTNNASRKDSRTVLQTLARRLYPRLDFDRQSGSSTGKGACT